MSKHGKILIYAVVALTLLGITARVAYEFGERRTAERILHSNLPADDVDGPTAASYDKSIATLRDQLNRLTNDYESACYNYQTLYAAYDELYAKAGASSGQQKIALPDGARGNEESCYR
jgi:hypothetical protein